MTDGLKKKHRQAVIEILTANPRVDGVVLFGSRAMGTHTIQSDVDLALLGDQLTLDDESSLAKQLEQLSMPQEVDLLRYENLQSEKLRKHIQECGKEWYRRDGSRQIWRGWAMGSEPRSLTIDELLAESGGEIKTGPFGTKLKAAQYTATGVPLISVREIERGRIVVREDTPRVDESITSQMPEYVLRRGDIVFGRKGAVERNAIVTDEQHGWFLGSDGIRLRLSNSVCNRFIAYQLMALSTQAWLKQHAGGTTMPSLNQKIIGRIPIVLLPLWQQTRASEILSSLDDKIALNRRMNGVLESMARAIFKAWFIDFEPVRAKAAGATNFPGMPQSVFDGLPDRLVDSELGEIPEGWEAVPLDALFEVNPRRTLKKGENSPYLAMKDMPTQGHAPDTWSERPFGSGMRFRNGDTLVARITPCLENGKTAFVDFLPPDVVGWGSTEYIVLHPLPPLPPVYAYCLARSLTFRNFAIANMTGTSGRQRVPASSLSQFPLVQSTDEIVTAFGKIIDPLFSSAAKNKTENRVLASIRDTLLPKLISGELRVPGNEGVNDGE